MDPKGFCYNLYQRAFSLCFPVKVLQYSLTFRSLIHFEFIFVYGVRKCSSFILFFTSGWPVFSAPLVKQIVFTPLYILVYFVNDKVSIGVWIYLWAFYFVPLIYISVFVTVPYWLCGIVWSQAGGFLQFHSSFSRLLWLFEAVCISIQTVKLFVVVLWKYRW